MMALRGRKPRTTLSLVAAVTLTLAGAIAAAPSRVVYLAIDLRDHTTIAVEHPERLDTPIAPGSTAKVAALAAALEAGVVDERTGIACTRTIVVDGHRLVCTHPDVHRPLKAAEALAHSCNVYFATIAARLPRASLDAAFTALGLPPSDPRHPVAAAAIGVEGIRATPRQLLEMVTRVSAQPSALPWRGSTLTIIREGLRGAATYGTADVFTKAGFDALAKTGTVLAEGVTQGVVVGVTPASAPRTAFVMVASGVAGTDAAALTAERLKADTATTVRVGITQADGRTVVRTMPLDDYVAAVVAGEAAPNSSAAALNALAITVRTFALANLGRHASDGFDLCDLTHCQALAKASGPSTQAAKATAGRVLLDRGKPASVFYTASCGGHSEKPSSVWPRAADPPFLPSQADDACGGGPRWTSEIAAADLVRAFHAAGLKGDTIRDLRVSRRTDSGRAAWLAVDGFTPHEVSGDDFRTLVGRTVGWQLLKSAAFDVRRTSRGYEFAGHGSGHGVGLCVVGSAERARRGETTEQILTRYFPGLTISNGVDSHATTAVAVVVPDEARQDEPVIRSFAARVLTDLSATLNVNAPSTVTLRFHPTVESYQRATGRPWFTSAATRGATVDLLPVGALRARGLLEQTVKHELVHVLTGGALAGRPLWVSEGVAAFYAGERIGNVAVKDRCPADERFTRSQSAEDLRNAYAQAAACVTRAWQSGTAWRDIGP